MPDNQTIAKKRVPRTKRYKKLRMVSLLNVSLLVLNIFGFFWVSDLTVERSKAAEVGLCIEICAQGNDGCTADTTCADLINPPAPEVAEEIAVTEEETVVVIPSAPITIFPSETPLALIAPEEITRNLVVGEQDVAIYQHIYELSMPGVEIVRGLDGQGIGQFGEGGSIPTMPYTNQYLIFGGKTSIPIRRQSLNNSTVLLSLF